MDLSTAYDTMWADLGASFSLVLVSVLGLVIVVWDAYRPRSRGIPRVCAVALLFATVLEMFALRDPGSTVFYDMLRDGGFAAFVRMVILLGGLLTVLLSVSYLERAKRNIGEVYSLLLFSMAGMIVLGTANNLVAVFVGLETMSICLYVMAGLFRTDEGGTEAAIKYFVLGAFSTGFFLYGIALIYGATGTMYLDIMAQGLSQTDTGVMFWGGVSLLFVGFLFKVSAVPFHMWTPDVYQGAPTTLTGFMSTASKAAAFASLILILHLALPDLRWSTGLAVIAALTMVLGNIVALAQSNVKRMLAYSSIAHAGYILVGLAAGSPEGLAGALYYLLVYTVMNVGAFGVMAMLEWDGAGGRKQTLNSLAGIGYRKPLLGVTMGFFMFSLTGFPPLGGFWGKYAVFAPAVQSGLIWLVVLGVLASAASAYYYLRVLYVFWMSPSEEGSDEVAHQPFTVEPVAAVTLVVCAAALLALGVFPQVLDLATDYFVTDGSVAVVGK